MLNGAEKIGVYLRIVQMLSPIALIVLVAFIVLDRRRPVESHQSCGQAIVYDKRDDVLFRLDQDSEVEKVIGRKLSEKLLAYFHRFEKNNKRRSIALYNEIFPRIKSSSRAGSFFKQRSDQIQIELQRASSNIEIDRKQIKVLIRGKKTVVSIQGLVKEETKKGTIKRRVKYAVTLLQEKGKPYEYQVTDIVDRS